MTNLRQTAERILNLIKEHALPATVPCGFPSVTKVLIDMEGVNYLDLEGSDMLNEITKDMKDLGVEIHPARVKREVMEILEKDWVDENIRRNHIHHNVFETVRLFTQKEKHISGNDSKLSQTITGDIGGYVYQQFSVVSPAAGLKKRPV